jgi:elongation factor Ts
MATVNASMIKELRDRTGIGMTQCKKALEESSGNLELAIDNLRKAGMASAVKKEGRETKEGLVTFAETGSVIALVEVMAETDFVVSNEKFREFLQNISEEVAQTQPASVEALMQQTYSKDSTMTVEEYRGLVVQTVGENVKVRRLQLFEKNANKSIGVYLHLGGKIGTVVELEGAVNEQDLAKGIAMHVAAASPEYLSAEEVPADIIQREKDIASTQMQNKPANIIDKILVGKMKAFYDENCLINQKYIRDDKHSISEVVASRSKELGKTLVVKGFVRWAVQAG